MIEKINKIKNLGLVFSNYTWKNDLPSFKKFNLIYGWNGSGKTTFSRLFDYINNPSSTNLEYEIQFSDGNKYKQADDFPVKIRIFNQDYIQNNIKILEGKANSISILLGEASKESVEQIENDRKLLNGDPDLPDELGKVSLRLKLSKDKERTVKERDGKFTEIAKTIGAAIGGSSLRDYRKPQAEKDFSPITEKAELSQEDLAKYSLSAKQDSLLAINRLILKDIDSEEESNPMTLLVKIEEKAVVLLKKTVDSEVIARLSANSDIADWVEQGINLHAKHSTDICEYCQQKIPQSRIEQFARYFNEEDRKLKVELNDLVEELKKIYSAIQTVQIPDKARFYTNLQNQFDSKKASFEEAKQSILIEITALAEELKSKKSKTTEIITLKTKPDSKSLSMSLDGLNDIIDIHNKTTSDFNEIRMDSVNKLKQHYLSTIFDEIKVYDKEISNLSQSIEQLNSEISEIQNRININAAKISSQHKACDVINEKLEVFLGHKELNFTPHTEAGAVTGYNIMRGSKPANHLSEGERTAIAFVYFVVHLGDQDFKVDDGIVVIDDPISSLDSNSLYQAFSFLKNAVKNGKQVFVLTHSFDFLKLLLNWRRSAQGGTGYYMIKNEFSNDTRSAFIDKMDKELCNYESEYHYLFKLLKQLRDDQDDSISKAYSVPNIARKVWETFLMFRVPNGANFYKKMDELKEAGYDEQKLDAIYKFTNNQSHITGGGFDPALVPETKKVINELFEMMEEISPDHFNIIDKATN
jgi:wobble nucleotide-excising tRNase